MAKKALEDALQPGESFVWTGEPNPDKVYGKVDKILLPLSIFCMLLSIFFAVAVALSVRRKGFSMPYAGATLMLLLFGGFSVYSYFFRFAAKKRRKTELRYGVTNFRRIIILDQKKLTEYDATHAAGAEITETDKNGNGTIYILPKTGKHCLDNCGLDFLAPSDGFKIALFDVDHCKKVLKFINGSKH